MTKQNILLLAVAAVAIMACGDDEVDTSAENADSYAEADTQPADTFTDDMEEEETAAGVGDADNPVSTDKGGDLDSAIITLDEVFLRSDVDPLVENSFERADTDTDGNLTQEEYLLLAPAMGQATNAVGQQSSGDELTPAGGEADKLLGEGWQSANRETFFSDTAGEDNVISRAELRDAVLSRFDAADRNENGVLNGEEKATFTRLFLAVESA
ncbi:MAG: hypothetical protein AAGA69_03300 [Pseudomonadota bacterium]